MTTEIKDYLAELDDECRDAFHRGLLSGWLTAGDLSTLKTCLLLVLNRRGLAVTEAVREYVFVCEDRDEAWSWLEQATLADDIEDVFGNGLVTSSQDPHISGMD